MFLALAEVILGTKKEVPMLAYPIMSLSTLFVIVLHSVLEVCMIRDIRSHSVLQKKRLLYFLWPVAVCGIVHEM